MRIQASLFHHRMGGFLSILNCIFCTTEFDNYDR